MIVQCYLSVLICDLMMSGGDEVFGGAPQELYTGGFNKGADLDKNTIKAERGRM